ncbi:5'-3' exonuclease [Paraliobacillus ryukyuensis]|uniref:5'-3' exonuclease n=1 Tax=Paraliobacillus ryukyuensis TaxID=200904 RepID=UPI0009A595E8|nr:5'-3' exonuclease H3TH domain-containing protein [Paraliobacillus ryukyuensis]
MWQQEKLLLIDGFNLLSRSYFATAYNKTEDQLTRNSSGLYTNALRVFFQKMYNLIKQHGITHIAIAWDVKREETDRRQAHDFYKANRNELPPALIQQYETLTKALDQIGMIQFVIAPHEADDIIGALSHKWSLEKEKPCLIYSNDKDLLQLLNSFTSQIMAQKRQELVYTVEHFEAEYGIQPSQWIDVKALLGDSSDNIPGCPGVGAKSALPLIQQYETIEQLFNQLDVLDTKFNRYKKKLTAGEASAFMSKELVTINRNIPKIEAVNLNELLHEVDERMVRETMDELELRIKL